MEQFMRASALSVLNLAFVVGLAGCDGCNDQELTDGTPDAEPEFSNDAGSWLSMAVTPEGKPAVAYYDRTMDALGYAVGTVASDGAVTWAREEVDSYPDDNGLNPGDVGRYASMAIAGDGQVWIAYYDASNAALKYAHKGDGVWEIANADVGGGAKPNAGLWASLALDASGKPVIAHHDEGKGDLRVARYNGSGFSAEVVSEGEDFVPADTGEGSTPVDADVGEYARLYIASDGTEYIAYYDRAHGALRLAVGSAGAYTISTVDDEGDVGQWPAMVMNGSDLWIAYHDVTNQDLKVAVGKPGNFTLTTVDTGDHVGADTAIWVDDGAVGITYFDGFNSDMKLARLRGDTWSVEKVSGDSSALGFHNESVRIGSTRYVASYDFTNRSIFFAALP